ncbi:hypothetical protein HGM15179_021995, partial [Zosterops borbonicus]
PAVPAVPPAVRWVGPGGGHLPHLPLVLPPPRRRLCDPRGAGETPPGPPQVPPGAAP